MTQNGKLVGLKILLLEDELFIANALRDHFLLAGAELVEVASTVSGAVTLVEEYTFDGAVLDILLPEGDAGELASTLLGRGVRLVFHSGHSKTAEIEAIAPDAAFVQKPCDPEDLIGALLGG